MYNRENGAPNDYFVIYIKGYEYNPCFKWNKIEDFIYDLKNNVNIPKLDDIVVEAYLNDNLIDMGNTFDVLLNKLKLMNYI